MRSILRGIYLHTKMNKSDVSLGRRNHSFPIRQKFLQSVADGLLEDFPNIFRSHIKVLPNLTLLDPIGNHLLVALADISKVYLVVVCRAVLTNLPESNGSDCIITNIKLSTRIDAFTHLDHGLFFRSFDLSLSADTHDDMSRMRDWNELDLIFEEVIEFPDHILPSSQADACKLANIELLEVIFFFEAGRIDRIA